VGLTDAEKLDAVLAAAHNSSSTQDGMIDIISVRGCLHIGQCTLGLSTAQKLCQASNIEMRTTTRMPVQVDGEPWGQGQCTFKVSTCSLFATRFARP
jgi:diacylglycerol kinase (ATP)